MMNVEMYTERELRDAFNDSLEMIDFKAKWLHFSTDGSRERVSFDGTNQDLYWRKPDWENQELNPDSNRKPRSFYREPYYDWNGVCVGFCYGGPHYYTTFREYPNGRVVCLGGNGRSGSDHMQVVGDWIYWDSEKKMRQNINTLEQQRINLKELRVESV